MIPGTCWCCGQECMFCDEDERCSLLEHWCSECKFGACPDCCGCDDCRLNKRAGWTPAGQHRTSHGGVPLIGVKLTVSQIAADIRWKVERRGWTGHLRAHAEGLVSAFGEARSE